MAVLGGWGSKRECFLSATPKRTALKGAFSMERSKDNIGAIVPLGWSF